MAMALLTLSHFFAPLQAWFAPPAPKARPPRSNAQRLAWVRGAAAAQPAAATAPVPVACGTQILRAAPAVRPLRVVRVMEPQGQGSGRLRISGRMADVCAELDRLAALENAQQR